MYLYTLNLLQCNPFTAMSFFFSIITDRVDLHLDIHLQLFIKLTLFSKCLVRANMNTFTFVCIAFKLHTVWTRMTFGRMWNNIFVNLLLKKV